MNEVIMCTARGCPMESECFRQTKGNPDDPNQSYVNYIYTCNENSCFDNYIPYVKETILNYN